MVPRSSWTAASKAGFVTLQYGQRRPYESGTPVTVTDGQSLDKIDFALPQGSVIVTRVTDEFGEPLADAPPNLFAVNRGSFRRGNAQSDLVARHLENGDGYFTVRQHDLLSHLAS